MSEEAEAAVRIREATADDIDELYVVRYAVRENVLSSELPRGRVAAGLETRGRGWVAEAGGRVVGFSMADREEGMIWALFLRPEWEGRGLGRALLELAVAWLWSQGFERIWLTTDPGSRAEGFYARLGWEPTGLTPKGEMRFELARRPSD